MDEATLTDRQKAWFASVRDGIERETGRGLDDWAAIARACPETKHRARLAWFKTEHGLGQNRASVILQHAFPATSDDADALWRDPAHAAIRDAMTGAARALGGVTVSPRKGFTAYSRTVQFAAIRPKGAGLLLGIALPPDADPRLVARSRATWSERLTAETAIATAVEIEDLAPLLAAAWERS